MNILSFLLQAVDEPASDALTEFPWRIFVVVLLLVVVALFLFLKLGGVGGDTCASSGCREKATTRGGDNKMYCRRHARQHVKAAHPPPKETTVEK